MRGFLFATVSVAAVALGAGALMRQRRPMEDRRSRRRPPSSGSWEPARSAALALPPAPRSGMVQARTELDGSGLSQHDIHKLTRNFLLYYIVPMWLAAGLADWYCHRATHIEETTGVKETLLHVAQLTEMGVPTLAALFLEINPPVLALMAGSFLVHEATALWDVSYAVSRRDVTPIEQHVHSFLEMLPLMALSFIGLLHWPQVKAMVGAGDQPADWSIRLKNDRDKLPMGYIVTLLGTIAALELSPYMEELWRDWSAWPGRLAPPEGEAIQARQKEHEWA